MSNCLAFKIPDYYNPFPAGFRRISFREFCDAITPALNKMFKNWKIVNSIQKGYYILDVHASNLNGVDLDDQRYNKKISCFGTDQEDAWRKLLIVLRPDIDSYQYFCKAPKNYPLPEELFYLQFESIGLTTGDYCLGHSDHCIVTVANCLDSIYGSDKWRVEQIQISEEQVHLKFYYKNPKYGESPLFVISGYSADDAWHRFAVYFTDSRYANDSAQYFAENQCNAMYN